MRKQSSVLVLPRLGDSWGPQVSHVHRPHIFRSGGFSQPFSLSGGRNADSQMSCFWCRAFPHMLFSFHPGFFDGTPCCGHHHPTPLSEPLYTYVHCYLKFYLLGKKLSNKKPQKNSSRLPCI